MGSAAADRGATMTAASRIPEATAALFILTLMHPPESGASPLRAEQNRRHGCAVSKEGSGWGQTPGFCARIMPSAEIAWSANAQPVKKQKTVSAPRRNRFLS